MIHLCIFFMLAGIFFMLWRISILMGELIVLTKLMMDEGDGMAPPQIMPHMLRITDN